MECARAGRSAQRFIGRERGYHGVGFGGMSVGGIGNNRKAFGTMLAGVDHLPHTYNREQQAFSKGEPEWGAHLADELERLVALNGDNTIAAVFVEPMAGSTAVLPAPKGYLQRLRAICDKYKILLVFDEVITGFGRLGHAFAAERYGVVPDMITFAKGVTSGSVPMGGVLVKSEIHEAFMNGPEHTIEFFHGYTYSAHPLAVAAALATLDVYRDEGLFERAKKLEPLWYDACMSLKGLPNVLDIRCVGITVGDRSGVEARWRRKARLRSDGSRLPRGRHDAARGRRLARDVAAADRQRKSDRRDFREGRADHQGGGIASRFARLGSHGNCSCARVTDTHLSNAPERLASRAGRL